jgi:hypothetical protein
MFSSSKAYVSHHECPAGSPVIAHCFLFWVGLIHGHPSTRIPPGNIACVIPAKDCHSNGLLSDSGMIRWPNRHDPATENKLPARQQLVVILGSLHPLHALWGFPAEASLSDGGRFGVVGVNSPGEEAQAAGTVRFFRGACCPFPTSIVRLPFPSPTKINDRYITGISLASEQLKALSFKRHEYNQTLSSAITNQASGYSRYLYKQSRRSVVNALTL